MAKKKTAGKRGSHRHKETKKIDKLPISQEDYQDFSILDFDCLSGDDNFLTDDEVNFVEDIPDSARLSEQEDGDEFD